MKAGSLAGTMVSIPQTVRARALGYRELVNMADLNTPYQHMTLATSRQFVAEHQDAASRFLQATVNTIAQMKGDKAGVLDVLAQTLSLDVEKDKAELEEAYDVLLLKYVPDMPYPTVEGVQVLLDALVAENPAAADYKPTDMIDTTLLDQIAKATAKQ